MRSFTLAIGRETKNGGANCELDCELAARIGAGQHFRKL